MASSLPTRLHSSDVAFDSVAAFESWTNGSSSSPGPELFVTCRHLCRVVRSRSPAAAQSSTDFATSSSPGLDWSAAFAAAPHSQPPGRGFSHALIGVAGLALRHVAALVAAALGPRRSSLPPSSPRRPHTYSRRPRRPTAALVAAALDASTPPPSTPPPPHPRRRRPRRRRPRRRRPHCSPAYTTLWLCVHCDIIL